MNISNIFTNVKQSCVNTFNNATADKQYLAKIGFRVAAVAGAAFALSNGIALPVALAGLYAASPFCGRKALAAMALATGLAALVQGVALLSMGLTVLGGSALIGAKVVLNAELATDKHSLESVLLKYVPAPEPKPETV